MTISVASGELLGIVGASGSGKSTLLHIVGTLTRPSSGSVSIDGIDTARMSDGALSGIRSRKVGFVFQDFFLLPGFSATENVENGLLYSGTPAPERRTRAMSMLERVQDSPPKIVGMAFVGLQQVWGVNRGVDRTLRGVSERIGNG